MRARCRLRYGTDGEALGCPGRAGLDDAVVVTDVRHLDASVSARNRREQPRLPTGASTLAMVVGGDSTRPVATSFTGWLMPR